ncbi:DUF3795 domain-containing protein [Candidatus Bathyarchaeota archaeon]|nr:DUF3795 domain-containing protein [Candidatus Bathyarchaeota archaeon]MBS7630391.1 DUF3795 domain-containing protein [Candidatus Bathyarchaeota archaeon]
MSNLSLVGRCGLYCGTCGVYRGYRDGGELLEQLAEKWNIPKEKFRCEGCGSLTQKCWGFGCEIVKCLNYKGYQLCHECEAFDDKRCDRYESIAERYLKRGEDIRKSLMRIKNGETLQWLDEQDRLWRCPSCGSPISIHAEKCYRCGVPR